MHLPPADASGRRPAAACYCHSCGTQIPAWFDETGPIYDVAEDDAAFARWMVTPCPECGRTPQEAQPRGKAPTEH